MPSGACLHGVSVTDHAGRAVVGVDDVDGQRVAGLADVGATGAAALTLEAFASAILRELRDSRR